MPEARWETVSSTAPRPAFVVGTGIVAHCVRVASYPESSNWGVCRVGQCRASLVLCVGGLFGAGRSLFTGAGGTVPW